MSRSAEADVGMHSAYQELATVTWPYRELLVPGALGAVEQRCREAALDMGLRRARAKPPVPVEGLTFRDPIGGRRLRLTVFLEPFGQQTKLTIWAWQAPRRVISAMWPDLDRRAALFAALVGQGATGAEGPISEARRRWARRLFRLAPWLRLSAFLVYLVLLLVWVLFIPWPKAGNRFSFLDMFLAIEIPFSVGFFLSDLPRMVRRRLEGVSRLRLLAPYLAVFGVLVVLVALDIRFRW